MEENDQEKECDFVVIEPSVSQDHVQNVREIVEATKMSANIIHKELLYSICKGVIACAAHSRKKMRRRDENNWNIELRDVLLQFMDQADDQPRNEHQSDDDHLDNSSQTGVRQLNNSSEILRDNIIMNASDQDIVQNLSDFLAILLLSKQYNARVRVATCDFLAKHLKPILLLVEAEVHISHLILASSVEHDAPSSSPGESGMNILARVAKATANQKSDTSWAKWACVGTAAGFGALALGYTGGSAAPIVGSSLGAVATASGISTEAAGAIAMGSGGQWVSYLFGIAGASLASTKTLHRMAGVSEFEFIQVPRDPHELEFQVESELQPASAQGAGQGDSEGDFPDGLAFDSESSAPLESPAAALRGPISEVRLTLAVTGWILKGPGEYLSNWNWMKESNEVLSELQSTNVLSLRWSTKELHDLGNLIQRFLKNGIASQFISAIARQTALRGVMSALAWPATVAKLTEVIDNTWSLTKAHADKVGEILAEVIASRVYGAAPITLVGYSWGARIIFTCLLHLARLAETHENPALLNLVENCFICGAPVRVDADEWRVIRTMVSGRFVNGYSTRDWVLSFCYRNEPSALLSPNSRIAGLVGTNVDNIEDMDFTSYIGSSAEYGTSMEVLWSRMNRNS